MADIANAINDIRKKIEREKVLINGARSMYSQTDNPSVQNRIRSSIHEYERNINYLTERLNELELKARPQQFPQQSAYGRGGAPAPPPKDDRPIENGRGYDAYGGRWQQPGPGIPSKSRQYTKLDLIKYDTPHTAAKIQHMLQQLEFKLNVEQKYKEGMDKMVKLYQMEGDRKARAETESKRAESAQKIVLLKQALKRYMNLDVDIADDDQRDDDSVNAPNMRRPLTGKLFIRVSAVKDVDHATTSRFGRGPETSVVIKIEDVPRQRTKTTRNDRWVEDFEIPVDKANEIEFTVYDKVSDQNNPIAFLWVRISDIAEELRRRRIEQEVAGSGWVSAERAQAGGSVGPGNIGRLSPTRGDLSPRQGTVGVQQLTPQVRNEGVEAWFALEPAGQILLTLNFVKENRGKRQFDGALGRQGAIRQRKEEIHQIYGHKFVMQQFYQIMRCALCGEFLKNAAGYQCEDCKYTCHKKCYGKVVTKCISKTNAETDPDEEKLNHRIPHRFEPLTNISANWCCHCGYILPLGKKNARKCTECGLTCHAQCTHLVPDFCGMSMEMANNILKQIRETKTRKASSAFASQNLSDRTFRQQPALAKKRDSASAPRTPSFVDDPTRREEINFQAQTLYEQQQQHQQQQIEEARRNDGILQASQSAKMQATAAATTASNRQQLQQIPMKQTMSQTELEAQQRFKRDEPPQVSYPSQPTRTASAAAAAALGITAQQQQAAVMTGYSPIKTSPQTPWRDQDKRDRDSLARPDRMERPESQQSMDSFPRDNRDRQSGADSLTSRPTDVFMPVVKQPIPAVMRQQERQRQLEQERLQKEAAAAAAQELVAPMVRKRIGLEDFNFLAVLGKGNFGKVMLAEAKKTRQLYAIKVLKKEFIVENDEVESTRSEKRVFLVANKDRHPFLLNLHSCFQTETRIYFVMEYISGGDLMLQIQRESFKPKRAQFYAAEILLALKYLHENKIIYRDLKLDNILLTMEGHIKIADYGLCKEKMGYGSTTNTFCGTPEFMAPEILLEQRYGRAVDWWAFGVLLYQMLLATSPFRGEDEDEIFDAILSDEPLYPIHMPRESVSILQKLLIRDPERRLGSGEGDAQEVMAHPYFRNINFDDIYYKRIPPPFIPSLQSATDTSNFDQEFTREVPVLTPVHSVLTPEMQEQFRGFSFVADPDSI